MKEVERVYWMERDSDDPTHGGIDVFAVKGTHSCETRKAKRMCHRVA